MSRNTLIILCAMLCLKPTASAAPDTILCKEGAHNEDSWPNRAIGCNVNCRVHSRNGFRIWGAAGTKDTSPGNKTRVIISLVPVGGHHSQTRVVADSGWADRGSLEIGPYSVAGGHYTIWVNQQNRRASCDWARVTIIE